MSLVLALLGDLSVGVAGYDARHRLCVLSISYSFAVPCISALLFCIATCFEYDTHPLHTEVWLALWGDFPRIFNMTVDQFDTNNMIFHANLYLTST